MINNYKSAPSAFKRRGHQQECENVYTGAADFSLFALEATLTPPQLIVIRGNSREVAEWQRELNAIYAPRRIVLGLSTDEHDLPLALADKRALTETAGYICRGTVCSEPLKSLAALIAVSRE